MNTFQQLIKTALDAKIAEILKTVPSEKRVCKEYDISEVRPTDLAQFMRDNNIPDDARFSAKEDEDGWGFSHNPSYTPSIWHWTTVPTNDFDKEKHIETRFKNGHFKAVFDVLTANGYKRQGSGSALFKEFDDTTPLKMYRAGDFDRLEKYYSLSFVPPTTQP